MSGLKTNNSILMENMSLLNIEDNESNIPMEFEFTSNKNNENLESTFQILENSTENNEENSSKTKGISLFNYLLN